MKLVLAGLRAVQLIFCAVVVGLSVSLAKGQLPKTDKRITGTVPATTSYAAFAGAFGLLAALVGCAALFVDALAGIVSWALDALAALVLAAGGIAFAIGLRGVDCGKDMRTNNAAARNALLNCGFLEVDRNGHVEYGCASPETLGSRCKMARADEVFLFFAFAVAGGALAASFLGGRKGGRSGTYV